MIYTRRLQIHCHIWSSPISLGSNQIKLCKKAHMGKWGNVCINISVVGSNSMKCLNCISIFMYLYHAENTFRELLRKPTITIILKQGSRLNKAHATKYKTSSFKIKNTKKSRKKVLRNIYFCFRPETILYSKWTRMRLRKNFSTGQKQA